MKNAYENYLELRNFVEALEPDFVKASEKKNKAAGRRARKGLQEIKKKAQFLRAQIQEELA